jgi:hypothetical protein
LGAEALQMRGSLGVDEPASWAARTLNMNLPGSIGGTLIMERISGFFAQKKTAGTLGIGSRNRKRGFWGLLAAESWIKLGKSVQAERCLNEAKASFSIDDATQSSQPWMLEFIQELQESIVAAKLEAFGLDLPDSQLMEESAYVEEEVSADFVSRSHRRSVLGPTGSVDMPSLSPARTREAEPPKDEGFE